MTQLDFIKWGLSRTDAKAECFAADLVDRWHEGLIPGQLQDVLGLTPREYQAWTTGGVSLLTIAHWHRTSHPPLNTAQPWFKLSGSLGREVVGYLDQQMSNSSKTQKRRLKKPAASHL